MSGERKTSKVWWEGIRIESGWGRVNGAMGTP